MVKRLFICLLCMIATSCYGQVGGKRSFEFLDVPNNARLAGLGGIIISLPDRDINFTSSNPALLNDTLSGFASASDNFYVAGVGQVAVSYAHRFNRLGMQHLDYGTVKSYEASGDELGEYQSGETALFMSKSHQISNFRLGPATVKMVFSSIAGYRASALMADVGGLFVHPQHDFSMGLAIKNVGLIYQNTEKRVNHNCHLM